MNYLTVTLGDRQGQVTQQRFQVLFGGLLAVEADDVAVRIKPERFDVLLQAHAILYDAQGDK